jgi:hypothetical protein
MSALKKKFFKKSNEKGMTALKKRFFIKPLPPGVPAQKYRRFKGKPLDLPDEPDSGTELSAFTILL